MLLPQPTLTPAGSSSSSFALAAVATWNSAVIVACNLQHRMQARVSPKHDNTVTEQAAYESIMSSCKLAAIRTLTIKKNAFSSSCAELKRMDVILLFDCCGWGQ
jgi:hypothetical protein